MSISLVAKIMVQHNIRRKHLPGLAMLLLLTSCRTGDSDGRISLPLSPQVGKVYQMEIYTLSTSGSSFGIVSDTTIFRFDLTPTRADTSEAHLKMLIRELRRGKHADSLPVDKRRNSAFAASMEKYLADQRRIIASVPGDSLTLVLGAKGQLLLVDGLDQLVDHVSQKTSLDRSQVKTNVREYLSPAALKDLMTELFFYLPGKEVFGGDSWVSNTMAMAHAPIKYSNMIKLDTIQTGVAKFSVNTRISAGGEGNTYLDGSGVRSITSDRLSGFPLNAEFRDETVMRTTGGEVKMRRMVRITCFIKRL